MIMQTRSPLLQYSGFRASMSPIIIVIVPIAIYAIIIVIMCVGIGGCLLVSLCASVTPFGSWPCVAAVPGRTCCAWPEPHHNLKR